MAYAHKSKQFLKSVVLHLKSNDAAGNDPNTGKLSFHLNNLPSEIERNVVAASVEDVSFTYFLPNIRFTELGEQSLGLWDDTNNVPIIPGSLEEQALPILPPDGFYSAIEFCDTFNELNLNHPLLATNMVTPWSCEIIDKKFVINVATVSEVLPVLKYSYDPRRSKMMTLLGFTSTQYIATELAQPSYSTQLIADTFPALNLDNLLELHSPVLSKQRRGIDSNGLQTDLIKSLHPGPILYGGIVHYRSLKDHPEIYFGKHHEHFLRYLDFYMLRSDGSRIIFEDVHPLYINLRLWYT